MYNYHNVCIIIIDNLEQLFIQNTAPLTYM